MCIVALQMEWYFVCRLCSELGQGRIQSSPCFLVSMVVGGEVARASSHKHSESRGVCKTEEPR